MNTTDEKIFDTFSAITQGQDPITGNPLEDTSFLLNEKIVENPKEAINTQNKLEEITNNTKPTRHGEKWAEFEEQSLIHHFMKGVSIIELAKIVKRAETAVAGRIIRSGVLDKGKINKSIIKKPGYQYRTGLQWNSKEVEIFNDLISLGNTVYKISPCLFRDVVDVIKMSQKLQDRI
jgi:hypothetical protein